TRWCYGYLRPAAQQLSEVGFGLGRVWRIFAGLRRAQTFRLARGERGRRARARLVSTGVAGDDWISLTTDYGLQDGFVAACRGVLGRMAPAARVIDVTHQVPPGDVARGSAVLAQTVPYLPRAVHVAVVDPGVGTARRGVAVECVHGALVGPDN